MASGRMTLAARFIHDIKSRRATDYLAIAIAVSFPWSTSATGILMFAWVLAYLPTFKFADLRRELFTPAGGLPLLVFAWAVLGMLWADATWAESLGALRQFMKLLFIPVLLAYFRQSKCGLQVMAWFVLSCIALLVFSFIVAQWPSLHWGRVRNPGVPVKNYITQSAEFAIAAFCLFYIAFDAWKARAFTIAVVTFLMASAFIANMIFVVTSRTELVVVIVLIVCLGARLYGWKGMARAIGVLGVVMAVALYTSSYLRDRIDTTIRDFRNYQTDKIATSTGLRVEFLKKSIEFVAAAPVIGNGTGSIETMFVRAAQGKAGLAAEVTNNPHNQFLAVAIQLGLIGVAILCAMWFAHMRLFLGPGMTAWFGLVIVVQNFFGSFFNSHLFDFTEGWIYACGVGALGGACLRGIDALPKERVGRSYLFSLLRPSVAPPG